MLNMKKCNVLVVGKNEAIVELLTKLVNKYPELSAQGISQLDQIPHFCQKNPVDLLLFSSGLCSAEEKEISDKVSQFHSSVKTLEHFGGGSGLLRTELNQALGLTLAYPE